MTCHRFLSPPLLLLAFLLLLPVLHVLAPGAVLVPSPWNLLGLAPVGFGIALNVVADRLFTESGTSIKPTARPTSLVTSGPFSFSRNPMYLGFGLLILGFAILLGTAAPVPAALSFFPLADRFFVRREEAALEVEFGVAWDTYTRRVRRWL